MYEGHKRAINYCIALLSILMKKTCSLLKLTEIQIQLLDKNIQIKSTLRQAEHINLTTLISTQSHHHWAI